MIPKSKIAIIGEAPNRSNGKGICEGKVGQKLADLIGIHAADFYRETYRFNLNLNWGLPGHPPGGAARPLRYQHFDFRQGRERADDILRFYPSCQKLVLLGRRVAKCFRYPKSPFLTVRCDDGKRFLLFPHPSGRNRWWNDPQNVRTARRVIRKFVGDDLTC